jgi:hypothetical protein
MSTPLIPQECYLLERYSSPEYFQRLCDAFAAMLNAAELALQEFMQNLPPNYRSRHLSQQPDVVWGERVLPNFRWTMDGLSSSNVLINAGDLSGLSFAGNVPSMFAGLWRDHDIDWMSQARQDEFSNYNGTAAQLGRNIASTSRQGWGRAHLSTDYDEDSRGLLDAPKSWPIYQLNSKVRLKTGDSVITQGLYLPEANKSCAEFMIIDYKAGEAKITDTSSEKAYDRCEPTTWTLVERIADTGGGIPGNTDPLRAGVRIRVMGNRPCPNAGYYFTPAQSNSRRHFKQGDTMPSLGGDYGVTIWQWDADQNSPRS